MTLRIFITGYLGYIGTSLSYIITQNYKICDIYGYDLLENNDILDYDKLKNAMIAYEPHVVIHLAAASSITQCNNNVMEAIKINALGTRNVINAMKASGCINIIYASTSSVYGSSNGKAFTETSISHPNSHYAYSKLLGEHVIMNEKDINYIIFRMFNVVGNSGNAEIDAVIKPGYDRLFTALKSGNITIYGNKYRTYDGTCERDYVSLKDTCMAYLLAINHLATTKKQVCEILNVCTGIPISVLKLVKHWNNQVYDLLETNKKYRGNLVEYSIGESRAGDPALVYGSNEKIYRVLHWKPSKNMDDIIYDLLI